MKIHYVQSIGEKLATAIEKNQCDLSERHIDFIELTRSEFDELTALCRLSYSTAPSNNRFMGVRITVAE